MKLDDQLFQKNWQYFSNAFGSGRLNEIDLNIVKLRRDESIHAYRDNPWKPIEENFLLLPTMMPASQSTVDYYRESHGHYQLGRNIEQYLDVPGDDPHTIQTLIKLRDIVEKTGFDPDYNYTTTQSVKPYFLVVLATGSGHELMELIKYFKPKYLVLSLDEWNDFVTSFWHIDWQRLYQEFKQEITGNFNIRIGRHGRPEEIPGILQGINFTGQDHSLIYRPSSGSSDKSKSTHEFLKSKNIDNTLTYLGFTLDEYNMIWDSWKSLKKSPLVFNKPSVRLDQNFLICGSGPSLDKHLDDIKHLSRTHFIVACASNYGTLRKAGINVDIFCLLERGSILYTDDYNPVIEKYGQCEALLFASTTTDSRLHDLFSNSLVYFRPVLTPLSIFSTSLKEVLNFEGPQTINTGLAVAHSLGASSVVLYGVDLGTPSLEKTRSNSAAGESPRDFSLKRPGNFREFVYTDRLMEDGRLAAENLLNSEEYQSQTYNCSDGVLIKGALPCRSEEYQRIADQYADKDPSVLNNWKSQLSNYDTVKFETLWRSRRPRSEISKFIASVVELLDRRPIDLDFVLCSITGLLSLDVPLPQQFPRRLMRSTLHKIMTAIYRQATVMNSNPEQSTLFVEQALKMLVQQLYLFESELYELCDKLESI